MNLMSGIHRGIHSRRDQHKARSSTPGCSTSSSVSVLVCSVECYKRVEKKLSLRDSLILQGNIDRLRFFLLSSPESLCHLSRTNPCFSSLCTQERHQTF